MYSTGLRDSGPYKTFLVERGWVWDKELLKRRSLYGERKGARYVLGRRAERRRREGGPQICSPCVPAALRMCPPQLPAVVTWGTGYLVVGRGGWEERARPFWPPGDLNPISRPSKHQATNRR